MRRAVRNWVRRNLKPSVLPPPDDDGDGDDPDFCWKCRIRHATTDAGLCTHCDAELKRETD